MKKNSHYAGIFHFDEPVVGSEAPFDEVTNYLRHQLNMPVRSFTEPLEFVETLVHERAYGGLVSFHPTGKMMKMLSQEFLKIGHLKQRLPTPVIGLTYKLSEAYLRWFLNNVVDNYFDCRGSPAEIADRILVCLQNSYFNCQEELSHAEIAIIDDREFSRNALKMTLMAHGVKQVDGYESGESLLERHHLPYNLFLIDIVLTTISGIEVIHELKKRYPQAVILAVSSVSNPRVASMAIEAGALGFIKKPVDMRGMIYRILSFLSYSQSFKSQANGESPLVSR